MSLIGGIYNLLVRRVGVFTGLGCGLCFIIGLKVCCAIYQFQIALNCDCGWGSISMIDTIVFFLIIVPNNI